MSDKELIFQAASTFTKNLVSNLFGNALRDVMKARAKEGYVMRLFGKPIKFGEMSSRKYSKR